MFNFKNIITAISIVTLSILFFFFNTIKLYGNLTYLDLIKFIVAILTLLLAMSILFNFKKFFFININYFKSIIITW